MKNRALLLVVLLLVSTLMFSVPCAADGTSRDGELDAIVDGGVEGSPPLSGLQLLVIRGGDVAYEYAHGFARLTEKGKLPLGPEHRMRIASISKLVAAVGLMRLVEAAKVDLDKDVSEYLGFDLRNPNFPTEPITLRMILSHTSSIRDGSAYWMEAGERFEDFFLAGRPHYDGGAHFASGEGRGPGRFFTYSNLNFGIVAAVIERVSGQRFDRYMRSAVLEPLGLPSSYNVCDLSATQPEKVATLFRKRDENEVWQPQGDWVPQLDHERFSCHYGREPVARGEDPGEVLPGYVPGSNPTLFSPQGGLRASARDLAVIGRMLMAGGTLDGQQILTQKSVEEMFTPQWHFDANQVNGNTEEGTEDGRRLFAAYGLSVHVMDLEEWALSSEARVFYGHLGSAYGLMGQFWLDPERGDALISLISGAGDDPDAHPGVSPMYRPSDEIMRWWLRHFPR